MMTSGVGYAQDDGAKPGGQPISSGKPEVPADEEPDSEPMPDEKVEPDSEPEPLPVPISEPKPVQTLKADKKKVDKPVEWRGFVHIRCEACHKEATFCLRAPITQYTCRNCNHKMELRKPYLAYTRCECGQAGRYLTNNQITLLTFPAPPADRPTP